MQDDKPKSAEKQEYGTVEKEHTFGKVRIKKKFLKKARALQSVILDPLNVQTGVAASIIINLIEGSLV